MEKKVAEMLGCTCLQWQSSMREIITVFIKADELGIKYHGGPFQYCPFCGSSLVEISKFKSDQVLFFQQGKRRSRV